MSTSTLDQLEVVVLDCLLRLRSPNYVVICAIFGNDDDDEASDKFAALSCRRCMLPVASCKLQVASCQLPSVKSMSIGLLMAANAST